MKTTLAEVYKDLTHDKFCKGSFANPHSPNYPLSAYNKWCTVGWIDPRYRKKYTSGQYYLLINAVLKWVKQHNHGTDDIVTLYTLNDSMGHALIELLQQSDEEVEIDE